MDSQAILQDLKPAKPARSLIESVYQELRQNIIEGLHAPGEKLRVEHLKSRYEVSSSTLREALALLVSDSLVVAQSQRGFHVAPMSLADVEDLTRTRVLVECAALRDSIEHGDDAWEARIVSAYYSLSRIEERMVIAGARVFDEWEERNQAFHDALISACVSQRIRHFQALLYRQAHRYRRLSAETTTRHSAAHEEHQEIFEAAIARDIDRADHAMEKHIGFALTIIKSKGAL